MNGFCSSIPTTTLNNARCKGKMHSLTLFLKKESTLGKLFVKLNDVMR